MKKKLILILFIFLIILTSCGTKTTNTQKINYGDVDKIELSEDEEEYIDYLEKNQITIKAGHIPNRFPISQADKTGVLTGVNEDICNYITQLTGINFENLPIEEGKAPSRALTDGEFDIVVGVLLGDALRQNQLVEYSETILESSLVMLGRQGESINLNSKLTIAVNRAFQGLQSYIEENYDFDIVYYNDNHACANAVLKKKADIMIQNEYVVSYLLQNPHYEGLEIIPTYTLIEEAVIAVRSNYDARLLSILNKAILSFDQSIIKQIVINNTIANPYELTVSDFFFKYRTPISIIIILIGVLTFSIIFIVILKIKHDKEMDMKNNELKEAVIEAQNANKVKGEFLARMSHEIRTPMNAIVGFTTLAQANCDKNKRVKDYLSKIDSSSRVLLNLINDVLDMSAIESNKLKISNKPFNIKHVINNISTMYYSLCKEKGIEFECLVDVRDENLIGDELRISQVLLNLISNAYKFTPSGGKVSLIVTEDKREDKAFISFKVIDTGIGISEEKKEKLFDAFEQEDAEVAKKYGGSGLGLAITKNLIDLMHGAISVDSQKGSGTRFVVNFSFDINDREKEEINAITKLRLLLVDDDPNTIEYSSTVFKRLKVPFDVALSGDEALKLLENNKYNLCLIDWKMPGMDGVEVTRKIREKYSEDAFIIIVSAYDISEVEEKAKQAGANSFITKPLFQSTIFNLLMELSEGKLININDTNPKYDFKGKTILLAEDNELNREIAVEVLKMVNINCIIAVDGNDALEKYMNNRDKIDLILLDIQMPYKDGYQVCKEIRNIDDNIPILAMTANAFTEDISLSLASGMNGHVSKPIDTNNLYSNIKKFIK